MRNGKSADLAVWGRVPPPIGGMAVHLRRLLPHLAIADISVQMYSIGRPTPIHPQVRQVSKNRLRWFFGLLFGSCERVHYVLSDNTSARFAASLLDFFGRSKTILRVGGESLSTAASSTSVLERTMVRFAIRQATAVVGVSWEICVLATNMGAKQVIHAPGFIAESTDGKHLPSEVDEFLKANEHPVLLASGEIHDPEHNDLYGAYALLELLEHNADVSLVFYAYRITLDAGPQDRLADEIVKRGLQKRYLLFRSATDLLPAMLRCDILVRPTSSDGDSNSIREALHAGLPVIASDCVARPEGVITFPTGDPIAFQKTVNQALRSLDQYKQAVRSMPNPDNAKPIVRLIQNLLGRPQ